MLLRTDWFQRQVSMCTLNEDQKEKERRKKKKRRKRKRKRKTKKQTTKKGRRKRERRTQQWKDDWRDLRPVEFLFWLKQVALMYLSRAPRFFRHSCIAYHLTTMFCSASARPPCFYPLHDTHTHKQTQTDTVTKLFTHILKRLFLGLSGVSVIEGVRTGARQAEIGSAPPLPHPFSQVTGHAG